MGSTRRAKTEIHFRQKNVTEKINKNSGSENAVIRWRVASAFCEISVSLVCFFFVVFLSSSLSSSVSASPILIRPENMQGPISVARNIRHLPCISRRTGEEGVCMFAIDCLKANGSHLGTCIDRFYFGSCCQVPEKHELPAITDNHIEDKLEHITTESSKHDMEIKVGDHTIEQKTTVMESTTKFITTEIPFKLSTFQTVESNFTESAASTKPSVKPQYATKRPLRPTTKPTYKPHKPPARPTLKPFNSTTSSQHTTFRPRPTRPLTSFNSTRKPPYKPPPKRPQPTKRPQSPPRLNITFISQSSTLKPVTRPVTKKPLSTTIMYINTTNFNENTRDRSTTKLAPKTTQILPTISPISTQSSININEHIEPKPGTFEKPMENEIPEKEISKPVEKDPVEKDTFIPTTTQNILTESKSTIAPLTEIPEIQNYTVTASIAASEASSIESVFHETKEPTTSAKVEKVTTSSPKLTSTGMPIKENNVINEIPEVNKLKPDNVSASENVKPEITSVNLQPQSTTTKLEIIDDEKPDIQTTTSTDFPPVLVTTTSTDFPPGLVTWSSNIDSVTKTPVNSSLEETWSPITPSESWVPISTMRPHTEQEPSETTLSYTVNDTLDTETEFSVKPVTENEVVTQKLTTVPATTLDDRFTTESNKNEGLLNATENQIQSDKLPLTENPITETTQNPIALIEKPYVEEIQTVDKLPIPTNISETERPSVESINPATEQIPLHQKPSTEKERPLTEKPPQDVETRPPATASVSSVVDVTTEPAVAETEVTEIESNVTEATVAEFTVNVTLTPIAPSSTEAVNLSSVTLLNTTEASVAGNFSADANSSIADTATNETSASISVETATKPSHPDVNMSDYKDVCGRRLWPEARIVGGAKSGFGRWPWQISLRQWRTSTYLHKCGAALLNENWAITAAHCVEHVPPSELLVRLGEHDLAHEAEPYGFAERRIQIVASHPHFDPATFEYDLALLRFYEPVTFQPNILPVCVPDSDDNFVGKTAYVTGWGRLYDEGPLPSVLQEVSVPVINNTACEAMYRAAGYNEHIPNIFICAGWRKGGSDSCEGDSGGPMVLQRADNRFVLGGVISWGIGCAEPNQPGVYTRISEFRDWINQILQF